MEKTLSGTVRDKMKQLLLEEDRYLRRGDFGCLWILLVILLATSIK